MATLESDSLFAMSAGYLVGGVAAVYTVVYEFDSAYIVATTLVIGFCVYSLCGLPYAPV